jgi:DNA (cytosine-5)-methyltransferase 1
MAFAENDKWASEVLKRHWPDTPNLGDITELCRDGQGVLDGDVAEVTGAGGRDTEQFDLIHGGFPCQDLSVAGKRTGLGGERSGLWYEFQRILSEVRPRWTVIENVPGLLSSNGGRDFAVLLESLGECGFDGIGWAILDAQNFGVPQRRRRVFIVGGPSRRSVEQVLSICESCGGNLETGGEAGEDVAGTLGARAKGRSGGLDDPYVANAVDTREGKTWEPSKDNYIAAPVTASTGHHGHSSPRGDGQDNLVAFALAAREWKGPSTRESSTNYIPETTGVRRLTPLECERLMAFPDDWTRYDSEGNEIADSHRYRMCGNGVVATVAEWIGRRIMALA